MPEKDSRLNVAVLLGGVSSEREVSLASGRQVARALDPKLYRVRIFDPAVDVAKLVRQAKLIDVALVMLHGGAGENGTIQGLLDLLQIPYQCAGVLGCALAMDKPRAKALFRAAGLPVARDLLLHRRQPKPVAKILEHFAPPLVVKPAGDGSSVGVSIVRYKSHLAPALRKAFACGDEVLVEEFLAGRELTVAVLGNRKLIPLPVIEIRPTQKYAFFDYEAKYQPGASEEICPAPVPPEVAARVQEMALTAHRALGLKGYSRSDFIHTKDGSFILETNTVPGMTANSLLPLAARTAGLAFPRLLDRLIALALGQE